MAHELPIKIQEHAQLELGAATADTITMDCDRFLCVREKTTDDQVLIKIIDRNDSSNVNQMPFEAADSAVVNADGKFLAVCAGKTLHVVEVNTKRTTSSHKLSEDIEFCRWIDCGTAVVITTKAVYHLSRSGDAPDVSCFSSTPQKIFDRTRTLADSRITSYQTDNTLKWLLLIGRLAKKSLKSDKMQLYSVDNGTTNDIDGETAALFRFKSEHCSNGLLLAYTVSFSEPKTAKLHVRHIESDGRLSEAEKTAEIKLDNADDYPIALHPSEKYGILFVITHRGCVHLYDVESVACICSHRFSSSSVISSAPHPSGVVCIDKTGKIVSIGIDEALIVPYMIRNFPPDLALKFAARNTTNPGGADELFVKRFNELFQDGRFSEAAKIAACTPKSSNLLRTSQTIERFRSAVSISTTTAQKVASAKPLLQQYFDILLEYGKLNRHESLELCRFLMQQQHSREDNKTKVEKLLQDDKLECSQELGDFLKQYDLSIAKPMYERAGVSFEPKATAAAAEQQHGGFVETNENSVFSVDGDDADEYEPKSGRLSSAGSAKAALPLTASPVKIVEQKSPFGSVSSGSATKYAPFGSTFSSVTWTSGGGGGGASSVFGSSSSNTVPFGMMTTNSVFGSSSMQSTPSTYAPFGTTAVAGGGGGGGFKSMPSANSTSTPTYLPFGSTTTPTTPTPTGGGAAADAGSSTTPFGNSSGGGGFSFLNWNKTDSNSNSPTKTSSSPSKQPLGASASSSFDHSNRFVNSVNNLKRKSSAGAVIPLLPNNNKPNTTNFNSKHARVTYASGATNAKPQSSVVSNGTTGERSLFNERAKLYRFDTTASGGGAWKERGTGNIQLIQKSYAVAVAAAGESINKSSAKVSCVMHSDHTHKLCCNHLIQSTMRCDAVKPLTSDEKCTQLMWYANDYSSPDSIVSAAADNSAVESSSGSVQSTPQLRNELFRVRFKKPEQALRFQRVFQQAVSEAAAAASATAAGAAPADAAAASATTNSLHFSCSKVVVAEPPAKADDEADTTTTTTTTKSRVSSDSSDSGKSDSLKRTTSAVLAEEEGASNSSPHRRPMTSQSVDSGTNRSPEQQQQRHGKNHQEDVVEVNKKVGDNDAAEVDGEVATSPLPSSQQQPPAKRLCASSDD